MAPKPGWEGLNIKIGEDPDGNKALLFDGVIEDADFTRRLRLVAARHKISLAKAFNLMLETGYQITEAGSAKDGQHRAGD